MSAPASAPRASRFAPLLALALFLFIWSAKLLVLERAGTDLPFWDQWDKEGIHLLPDWFERHELWRPLFAPHNEHRIAPTLATNLVLVVAGGQWDARLQCIVNAALHAALLTGLFIWALRRFPLPWALAAGAAVAALGGVPIVWENTLSGFQSQFYFLAGFSLLALTGLLEHPALSLRWWLGFAAGACALVSMGSGFLSAAAVAALAGVQLLRRRTARRDALLTLGAAFVLIAAGLALHTSFPQHAHLRAHTLGQFLSYALYCLSWPHFDLPWLAPLLWLPWTTFAVRQLRSWKTNPASVPDRIDTILLAAGLWVLLQVAAVSFSRGGSGDYPAFRYGDLSALGLLLNLLVFPRLARTFPESPSVAALWSIIPAAALATAGITAWDIYLPAKKSDHLAYERHVREFVRTGDVETLRQHKDELPFPDANWLAEILRRPAIRERLPASVGLHPPTALSRAGHSLVRHSPSLFGASALAVLGLGCVAFLRRPRMPATLPAAPRQSGRPSRADAPPRETKLCTAPALLAALALATLAVIPFLPAAKIYADQFFLEGRVNASTPRGFRIYYDDGSGYQEKHSGNADLRAGPTDLHIPLAPGRFKAFRIDPLDGPGTLTISSLRVTSRAGWTIAELPLDEIKPHQQIASLARGPEGLQLTAAPGSDDPQLILRFAPELVIDYSWRDYRRGAWRILPVFAALALALFALDRAPRTRALLAARVRALAARPARAICAVAAVAVIASCYPVVFLGQSFVSPNFGTPLLYDNFPTLPGQKPSETVDPRMSDVGAIMWQHVPFSMIQHRALAGGELPLWNRYNAAGVPLLAQGQSMAGDPLHLLVIAADGAAWAWDMKYVVAKWLFATGLALTVLALASARTFSGAQPTALNAHLIPALLVAAATPFIGFFVYRLNHPAFFSLCYAPWPLYCFVRLAQASTARALAAGCLGLLVANLALMNSGTVKEAYMLLVCVNFSGACLLLPTHRLVPPASRLPLKATAAALVWTGLIFVLLTAPIWATFLQTLKNSYTGYNVASAYQIQPTLLLGFFDELFYRPVVSEDHVFNPSLNFLLLFGVLYFCVTLRHQFAHRAAIALALSSLLPLSLAFGFVSPEWIVRLPFLANVAHVDNTFSCALIVLWSVLAGVGFASALARLGTRAGRDDLIVGAVLLLALVFGWAAFGHAAHRPVHAVAATVNLPGQTVAVSPFIRSYLVTLLVALAVFALVLRHALHRRRLGVASGLVLFSCAVVLLWRHGQQAPAAGFENVTVRPPSRATFHAPSGAMEFARAAHLREPGRGYGIGSNFFPGWTGVYGLETIHGPDALVNPFLRELVGVSGVERIWDWRLYCEPATAVAARPFFDALNVRYYFDRKSDNPALAQNLPLVHRSDLDIYESPTAWPRAFFTSAVQTYAEPAELVQKIRAAAVQPFAAVQRSDTAAVAATASLAAAPFAPPVPATAYRLTENATTFRIRAPGPGLVVLSEAYWPGDSRAELDGRRVPVLRINHAFRGIVVDAAGDHTVSFYYWPRNFLRYLVLSGIGAGLLALSLFVVFRRTRGQPPRGRPLAPATSLTRTA